MTSIISRTGSQGPTGETGERGPTGDHGQTGDAGHDGINGLRGIDGMDGRRGLVGPMGLTGSSAPSRNKAVSVLLLISFLCSQIVIGAALYVAVNAGRNIDRLVTDRNNLREEVVLLRQEGEEERESDACYDAYTTEISEAAQIVRSVSTRMEAAIGRGLVSLLPEPPPRPPDAIIDSESLISLFEEADAAADLDKVATDTRTRWSDAGRPLPCPISTG